MPDPITLYPAEGVRLLKNVLIPTRDGTRLAADLYMPDRDDADRRAGAKFPVVVEYTPYHKDEVNSGRTRHYSYLPRYGYIVARVDVRGSGGSEGVNTDEYMELEQRDGYDMIEWIAQQPWCTGHVNMYGISYGGFSALQVAAEAPPHLTSIIPIAFTDDRYTDDCHYRGGLLRLYYDIGFYGNFMIVFNAMPPVPEWSGGDWAKLWEQHLAHNEPYVLKWLNHQTDDAYWHHGSVRYTADQIKCPVFLWGGWRDGYPNPPLRLFEQLKVPKKVTVGPWDHSPPEVALPGPRVDYLHEMVRWLDHWCKGKDTGIMKEPPVTVYMQEFQKPVVDRLDTPGSWRAESEWPAPGASEKILHLGGHGTLGNKSGSEGSDSFEYNPTVGVTGGLWSGGIRFGLPGDQRPDETFSLVYTSEPLTENISIIGRPRALLHVSSTAGVMGFAASLCEVAPDGTSFLVAKGMLNITRRKSMSDPEPLTPGKVAELDIPIDCTGWTFRKGNRIRLSVASADWPNVWPTPEPGINQVHRGGKNLSRLILPVVPAKGSATPPVFLPSTMSVIPHSAAPAPPVWEVTEDVLTGRKRVNLRSRSEYRVDERTVIHRESTLVSEVNPVDPANVVTRGLHVSRILRPQEVVEGSSELVIRSTATHFHVTIDLQVRMNNSPRFEKRWTESISRRLL